MSIDGLHGKPNSTRLILYRNHYNEKGLLCWTEGIEERKKGRWIEESRSLHYCSECGWALMDGPGGEPPFIGMEFNRANHERRYVSAGWIESEMNYCPNCGADMRGDADETD